MLIHAHGAHYFQTSSGAFSDNLHKFSDIVPANSDFLANTDGLYL